jgi:hypothetical protein
LYTQSAGNQGNTLPHAQQAKASSLTVVTIHVKSYSIIAHHKLKTVPHSLKHNSNILRLGMARKNS